MSVCQLDQLPKWQRSKSTNPFFQLRPTTSSSWPVRVLFWRCNFGARQKFIFIFSNRSNFATVTGDWKRAWNKCWYYGPHYVCATNFIYFSKASCRLPDGLFYGINESLTTLDLSCSNRFCFCIEHSKGHIHCNHTHNDSELCRILHSSNADPT